ncbi:hypothetical protein [Hymenobacter sp. YC55]|uniref:hypothetical protein n=1 Tax=Hymenobacter sp. YC55 TaxID=3034019 RepID=UPI0023F94E74|nr:hypothetical protein [Hymenobacter sp. YC55]MDF7809931.1 hypothetical protein [Hymenobacter sp. YC55]
MSYTLYVPLIVATVASGATAALYHHRFRYWCRRAQSLETQQGLHLQTIFSLQDQLQQMPRCTYCRIKRVPWASTLICDTCKAARPHEQH